MCVMPCFLLEQIVQAGKFWKLGLAICRLVQRGILETLLWTGLVQYSTCNPQRTTQWSYNVDKKLAIVLLLVRHAGGIPLCLQHHYL